VTHVVLAGAARRVRDQIGRLLRSDEQLVTVVEQARAGTNLVRTRHIDLVVLSLPLPQTSLVNACKDIRRFSELPILVIGPTEADDETKLTAFKAGADDYLESPFNPDELLARVAALIRRHRLNDPKREVMQVGDLVIDRAGAEVTVRGHHMQIPRKEFELLSVLVENQGRVLSRVELLEQVWGKDYRDENRTLDVHIKRLRTRIESDPHRPRHLVTIRGSGYKFSP
jgi:two-component system response regulator RegX3